MERRNAWPYAGGEVASMILRFSASTMSGRRSTPASLPTSPVAGKSNDCSTTLTVEQSINAPWQRQFSSHPPGHWPSVGDCPPCCPADVSTCSAALWSQHDGRGATPAWEQPGCEPSIDVRSSARRLQTSGQPSTTKLSATEIAWWSMRKQPKDLELYN